MTNKKLLWVLIVLTFCANIPHLGVWFGVPDQGQKYYQIAQNMRDGKWMWICEDSFFRTGCRVEHERYPLYPVLLTIADVIFNSIYVTKLLGGIFWAVSLLFVYKMTRSLLPSMAYLSVTYIYALDSDATSLYLMLCAVFFYLMWEKSSGLAALTMTAIVFARPSIALCLFIPYILYAKRKELPMLVVPAIALAILISSGASNPSQMFLASYKEGSDYYLSIAMPPERTAVEKVWVYIHNLYEAFFVGLPKILLFLVFVLPYSLFRNTKRNRAMIAYIVALGLFHSLYFIEPRYMVTAIFGAYALDELGTDSKEEMIPPADVNA